MKVKSILCPVDFSDNCETAIELAFSLSRESNATLYLVYAVHKPHIPLDKDTTGFAPTATDLTTPRKRLEEIKPGVDVSVVRDLLVGPPAAEILQYADKHEVDLIVMGTHGKTGLTRLLMGSVAEEIVRNAKCPVLTVKQPTLHPKKAGAH